MISNRVSSNDLNTGTDPISRMEKAISSTHYDVMQWKRFRRHWPIIMSPCFKEFV